MLHRPVQGILYEWLLPGIPSLDVCQVLARLCDGLVGSEQLAASGCELLDMWREPQNCVWLQSYIENIQG